MVHWQSDKILIVLIGISSLHFNLIRSDCSASGADGRGICTIDGIDRRRGNDIRVESKDSRDLSRSKLNGQRIDFTRAERLENNELNGRRVQSRLDDSRRQQRRLDERSIEYSRRDRTFQRDERRSELNARRLNENFGRSERKADSMALNVRRELITERDQNRIRDINRRAERRVENRKNFESRRNDERQLNRLSELRKLERESARTRFERSDARQIRINLERNMERRSAEPVERLASRRNNMHTDRRIQTERHAQEEPSLERNARIRLEQSNEQPIERDSQRREQPNVRERQLYRLEFERRNEDRRAERVTEQNRRSDRDVRTERLDIERRAHTSIDIRRIEENRLANANRIASAPTQTQIFISSTLAWQTVQAFLIAVLVMNIMKKDDTLKPKSFGGFVKNLFGSNAEKCAVKVM